MHMYGIQMPHAIKARIRLVESFAVMAGDDFLQKLDTDSVPHYEDRIGQQKGNEPTGENTTLLKKGHQRKKSQCQDGYVAEAFKSEHRTPSRVVRHSALAC